MNNLNQVRPELTILNQFVPGRQISTISKNVNGEESNFFIDKIKELSNTFQTMPKTYEQDGKGDQAVAYLHYFSSGCDWWITERDQEDKQHQAFGLVDLGHGPELGYISLIELGTIGAIELDLYWTPKTIESIKNK